MRRGLTGVAAVVLALTSVGCGASRARSSSGVQITQNNIVTQNTVVYDLGPAAEDDAFDPGDPRLLRALQRLSESLGHPVELALDLSTLPRPQRYFIESFLDRSVNLLPSDAERFASREPGDLAICAPYVQRVELVYDGSRQGFDASIDPDARVLRVSMRRGDAAIASNALSWSCRAVVASDLARRFESRSVASLSAAELGPYFRYVSTVLQRVMWRSNTRNAEPLVRLAERPEVRLTSTMIELERRSARAFEVNAAVREWLVDWTRSYGRESYQRRRALEDAKADHPWLAAGRELAAWLESARETLSESDREKVLVAALVPARGRGNQRPQFEHDVFPGLDVLRLGLQFWDGARRDAQGFPEDLPQRMCPTRVDSRGIRSTGYCQLGFFAYVLEDDALYPRLLEELRRRDDAALVETVFGAVGGADADRVLAMWRALEPTFASWSAATRAMVSRNGRAQRERSREVYDELVRQWRERPERHAALLFALATLETQRSPSSRDELVHFSDWTRVFGARVTAREYEAFLAMDPTSVRMAWRVFPAVTPGPSRVATLLRLLPRPVGSGSAERTFAGYRSSVWSCLGETIDALKQLDDRAALEHVRRYLESRAREHPSEDRPLRAYAQRAR